MQTFEKTDEEIKGQIIRWFALHHKQSADTFTGTEQFTLFDKLPQSRQEQIQENIPSNELAVLTLTIEENSEIVCTTSRFIYIKNGQTQELKYTDFDTHRGFTSVATKSLTGKVESAKTDGYLADFGLIKKDGQIIIWSIPTGKPGFKFWNITRKFSIIGRKYIRKEKITTA
jgi:hypothetical protein